MRIQPTNSVSLPIDLQGMLPYAETAEQQAWICLVAERLTEALALARTHAYFPEDLTSLHLADDGHLASVGVGQDSDGMGRFILNFAL